MSTRQDGAGGGGADAVVVGGGLVGICAALHLQSTGRQVLLVERDSPGDGASGHNAGVFSIANCVPTGNPAVLRQLPHLLMDPLSPLAIRWSYLPRLSPWLLRFAAASRPSRVESASIALKHLFDHAVDGYRPFITPDDSNGTLRSGGFVFGYLTEEALARDRTDLALRKRRGIRFDVLDGPAMEALDPLLATRFVKAVHFPHNLFTPQPRAFIAELAARFAARGGRIRRAEVRGFSFGPAADTVRSVETGDGPIPAGLVVIAAGAWSRPLARRLGTRVPLDTERGYGVHLPDPGIELAFPVASREHKFAMTPTGSGLRLVGTAELAGLAAPPDYRHADRFVTAARRIFPELRTDGATRWMSYRPSLPDSLPIIGRAPRQANVYFAFGHGHLGLTLAGVTGRLIQELADGNPATVDLAPFDPARFSPLARRRPATAAAKAA